MCPAASSSRAISSASFDARLISSPAPTRSWKRASSSKRTGEERVANGGVGVRAVADREEVAHPAGARLDQPEQHEPAAPEQERLVVLGDDPAVDRTLDDERRRDRRPLPDEASGDRAEHSPALAHDQAPEIAPGGASSLGLVLLHRANSARTCEPAPDRGALSATVRDGRRQRHARLVQRRRRALPRGGRDRVRAADGGRRRGDRRRRRRVDPARLRRRRGRRGAPSRAARARGGARASSRSRSTPRRRRSPVARSSSARSS